MTVHPNPPGDIPLYEGLGSEWNDILSGFPEDKRSEYAPKLKERLSSVESAYEPLKQWEDLQKSGINPEQVGVALNLQSILEHNPREVYDTIAKYLNITPQQAEQVVEELEEADGTDPRIAQLQQQVDTLAQIALAQRNMTTKQKEEAEQDALIDKELSNLRKKYGDNIPEDEILMRMSHKNLTAEQAYQDYESHASSIRKTRPSPLLMGNGGAIPNNKIDVTKLNRKDTKSVVAQMLESANAEVNK